MAVRSEEADLAGTVPRARAGGRAKGEFRCSECGYGVVVSGSLPICPMCRGETWEQAAWRPFTRTTHNVPQAEATSLSDISFFA